MGTLSDVKNSGLQGQSTSNVGFLAGINIVSLKEKASEIISGKPKGQLIKINWGSIGQFFFTMYRLPNNIAWSDSDEYTEYQTLAQYVKREFKRSNNRTLSFSFMMKQRENTQTQNDEELFEEDLLAVLDELYYEKNTHVPLDLFFNGGKLYMGQFSIDKIDPVILEMDQFGNPNLIEVRVDLTKYPESQETGVSFLTSEDYFRLKNL